LGNYRSTPPEQVGRAHAALKRKAAAKRQREAKQLLAEADELDRIWHEHRAKQLGKKRSA
jgi:hypothetical protein